MWRDCEKLGLVSPEQDPCPSPARNHGDGISGTPSSAASPKGTMTPTRSWAVATTTPPCCSTARAAPPRFYAAMRQKH
ncbi:hypothetical protein scyTo_0023243 [Scyliorhinus torazame]|uniref:Uncharacterized protein n=1 Tax=Scyliorhinus torazame TaxID=75743 RepID=A0A401Q612_SCYTO|nr:hypothetical protein [Scyliorhinus torazame]